MTRPIHHRQGFALADHRDGAVVALRLMATSDLHANLLAWDYHGDRPCPTRGLARLATLIHQARSEVAHSLLLDNGDFLHGTPLGDHLADHPAQGRPHPMIAAMNHLGYDAATFGNHEFSHGLPFLRRSLQEAAFPFVCSNIWETQTSDGALAAGHLLLTRQVIDSQGQSHPLRIGILGFAPPQTLVWEWRHLKGHAESADILATAARAVPALRAAGADLVIALSHSGIGGPGTGEGAENVSLAMAALPGVDAVIAGHTHLLYPCPDQPDQSAKPVVMPGFFGSHLGVIDLQLVRRPHGWQVAGHRAELRPISRRNPMDGSVVALVPDDPAIVALAMPDHDALQARSGQRIGQSPQPLHSYFALLTDSPALSLVAQAQAAQLTRALRATPYADLPVLSAVAPFKAGGRGGADNYTDIPAGPLLLRHATDLYGHPNSLVGLRLTVSELGLWLERSVSLYHQITPGARDADLIDLDFPSFNFDVIYGLSYRIDLRQPARFDARGNEVNPTARRITDLHHQGRPIAPDQMFALATNSYRSGGGSGFAGTTRAHVIHAARDANRDIVETYIRRGGQAASASAPSWGFVPLPGTTVLFDSNPRAAAALPQVPHLRLTALQRLPNGFQRFRLHL